MLLQHLKQALRRLTTITQAEPAPETGNYFLQGRAEISATHVRLMRRNGDNEAIARDDIDFITVDRHENASPSDLYWVNFRSFRLAGVGIPSTAQGFESVEAMLNTLEGFDTAQWRAVRESTLPASNVMLWQKKHSDDFTLTDSGQATAVSLDDGIYLENLNQRLSWGTYEDLARHPFVQTKIEPYPNPDFSGLRYVIANPVIANGLKLKQLYTLTDAARGQPNLDLPVLCYMADISLGGKPEVAFSRIAQHFDRYFGVSGEQSRSEDSLDAQWENGRTTVSLRCFYREERRGWDNVAWLQISHSPDVTRYYTSEYGNQLHLSPDVKWKTFPISLGIAADYRRVSNAFYTPACFDGQFPDQHDLLIWIDTSTHTLGIANRSLALRFDLDRCTQLMLVVRRFRGCEDGNVLELHHGGTSTPLGGVSDTEEFERHENAIAHLTGVKTGKCTYDEYY